MSMESTPVELHKAACEYAESHSCEDGGAYDGFVAGVFWLMAVVRKIMDGEEWNDHIPSMIIWEFARLEKK